MAAVSGLSASACGVAIVLSAMVMALRWRFAEAMRRPGLLARLTAALVVSALVSTPLLTAFAAYVHYATRSEVIAVEVLMAASVVCCQRHASAPLNASSSCEGLRLAGPPWVLITDPMWGRSRSLPFVISAGLPPPGLPPTVESRMDEQRLPPASLLWFSCPLCSCGGRSAVTRHHDRRRGYRRCPETNRGRWRRHGHAQDGNPRHGRVRLLQGPDGNVLGLCEDNAVAVRSS